MLLRPAFKSSRLIAYITLGLFVLGVLAVGYLFFRRFVYPDLSADVINYHFTAGKLGLTNFPFPFSARELYPFGLYSFAPTLDMVSYLSYLILGYRLGTALSLLAYLSLMGLTYYLLLTFFTPSKSRWLLVFFLLPILTINEGLFQLATYYVDNYHAFLLAGTLWLTLSLTRANIITRRGKLLLLLLGLLDGLILSKLTNLIYLGPSILLLLIQLYRFLGKQLWPKLLLFALPVLLLSFYYGYNFFLTRNPTFPFYNGLFHSPLAPANNWVFNKGPTSLNERIFYPIAVVNEPEKLGEYKEILPDAKLIAIFLLNLNLGLWCWWRKIKFTGQEKYLLAYFFLAYFLWQLMFGYSRYAIFLEVLGGMVSYILGARILATRCNHRQKIIRLVLVLVLGGYFWWSLGTIYQFNLRFDLGGRQTSSRKIIAQAWRSGALFARYTQLTAQEENYLQPTQVNLLCQATTAGYYTLIEPLQDKLLLNLDQASSQFITQYLSFRELAHQRLFAGAKQLNFATVVPGTLADLQQPDSSAALCYENLLAHGAQIERTFVLANFVQDPNFSTVVFTGVYPNPLLVSN